MMVLDNKVCAHCSAAFQTRERRAKFCCHSCWAKSKRTVADRPCMGCGRSFRPHSQNIKCCSLKCMGAVQSMRRRKGVDADRIQALCVPEPNTGCWLWIGRMGPNGYGEIRVDGKMKRAHRVSRTVFGGEFDHNLHVLHKCDVKICVNPDHLRLGTHDDNMRDLASKRRAARGDNPNPMTSRFWRSEAKLGRRSNV